MTVTITLTLAGSDTGPFNLYSNVDGYTSAFQTNVSRTVLVAGLTTGTVPDGTTEILVESVGACNRDLYLVIDGAPSTTTTTSSTSTTSSTTTSTPLSCIEGDRNAIATCSGGESAQFTINDGYEAIVTPGGYYYSGTGTRSYSAYIYDSTNSIALYSLTYTQNGSTPGSWTTFGSGNTLPAGTYYLHLNTVNCSINGSGTFTLQVGNCSEVRPTYYYYNIQRYDCGQDCEQGTTAVGRATNALDIGYFYHPPLDTFVYEILSPTTGPYYNVDLYGSPSRATCSEACGA